MHQFSRKREYTTEEEKVDVGQVMKLSEEEIQKKREEEIQQLQTSVSELKISKEDIEKEVNNLLNSIRQAEAALREEEAKTPALEKEYLQKKKSFDLLPNAEKNILQLQELSSESSNRLIDLANEWEKMKSPILQKYRELKATVKNKEDELRIKLEKIQEMRAQMKDLIADIRAKEEKYRELLEVYNKLPKDITRNYYTTRILEIVKNVKKQKVDINNVLTDTRFIQKEINSVTETLNRTFAVTEELIYQDAPKDPTAKEAYKQLVQMNELFKKLTKMVESTGSARNTILNLEAKIDGIHERTAALNFERIEKDLAEIRTENKALTDKLRAKELQF